MKTFLKTIAVGGYYTYRIYRIADFYGRVYYTAEPTLYGATRVAETEEELKKILARDAERLTTFNQRVR